jgi:hypothetical protein
VIAVGGRRILLYRGRDPDRARELAWRGDDAWGPKLARRARRGRAGAAVVVSGHSHVPQRRHHDDVLLVDPGAVASPDARTRQRVRTVARLFLLRDGEPVVAHVDLADPDRPFAPRIDWDAGFRAAHAAVTAPILSPDVAADRARLEAWSQPASTAPAERDACRRAWLRAAHRCWSGERETIGRHDLLAEREREPALSSATGRRRRAILAPS